MRDYVVSVQSTGQRTQPKVAVYIALLLQITRDKRIFARSIPIIIIILFFITLLHDLLLPLEKEDDSGILVPFIKMQRSLSPHVSSKILPFATHAWFHCCLRLKKRTRRSTGHRMLPVRFHAFHVITTRWQGCCGCCWIFVHYVHHL